MTVDGPASARLVAVLANVFRPSRPDGQNFDHRSISSEARNHPELLSALGFLDVQQSETGWRIGTLSKDSQSRIKNWLASAAGQEFDGKRLERTASGRYRVVTPRREEESASAKSGRHAVVADDPGANTALLTILADIFPSRSKSEGYFDHRNIASSVRKHPELLAALDFLGVEQSGTWWRAGGLAPDSQNRIKQWLALVEGQDFDGFRLERMAFGRYRVAVTRSAAAETPLPVVIADNEPASTALLAVLADVFDGGSHFDQRGVSSKVREHPELRAALEFLGVQQSTSGWRAGALSNDAQKRVEQWLSVIAGRELAGRRLERVALGLYRVVVLRPNLPADEETAPPPVLTDNEPANAALLAILSNIFEGGSQFDQRNISSKVREHPELRAALEALGVRQSTSGWRAGALSNDAQKRVEQWLSVIAGQEFDSRRLERAPLGRYRIIAPPESPDASDTETPLPVVIAENEPANAALVAILANVFEGGSQFDQRTISAKVREHPELSAALEFLGVQQATSGWRAGALPSDAQKRVEQWLSMIAGRELDGRRVDRASLGRYRVVVPRRRPPAPVEEPLPPLVTDNEPANAALLALLADIFWPGRPGGGVFDHQSIATEVRTHPQLFAALEFLGVRRYDAGWRAGALSDESKERIKHWLGTIVGRELDGRRLERAPLGRYRVEMLRLDELPFFC